MKNSKQVYKLLTIQLNYIIIQLSRTVKFSGELVTTKYFEIFAYPSFELNGFDGIDSPENELVY
jgi:hypothetical protein